MPIWQKIIIFFVVILYMVVNESERIETRRELDEEISIRKSWFYTEHEHFYNGPPKPAKLQEGK